MIVAIVAIDVRQSLGDVRRRMWRWCISRKKKKERKIKNLTQMRNF